MTIAIHVYGSSGKISCKGVVSTDMFMRKKGDSASSALSLSALTRHLLVVFAFLLITSPLVPAQGLGIGGYDVRSTADLAIAFDYNSSGYADHILFYRPGTGVVYILSNSNAGVANSVPNFSPVFASGNGIGGYDLRSTADRIIAFDYDGSGKKDHLVCYRPGQGVIYIIGNTGGLFSPVYTSGGANGSGIGGYPLTSAADQIIPFDYDGSGISNYLLLYGPGNSTVSIVKNTSGTFTPVFASSSGIGDFDLKSSADRIIAFDYYGYGAADHLVLYRPGSGTVWIVEQTNGNFTPILTSGTGIGSWDLQSTSDVMFAYDYNGTGHNDHLVAYRPGTGSIRIIGSSYFNYTPVYLGGGIAGFDLMSPDDKIAVADVNDAGVSTDLLIYRPGQGVVRILANSGGNFTTLFENQ